MILQGNYKRFFSPTIKIILMLILFSLVTASFNGCEQKKNPDNYNVDNSHTQNYFYKRLEGNIKGKGYIIMNLSRKDTVLTGDFYYLGKGEPIFFTFGSKMINRDSIELHERSGKFDEQFNEAHSGTFTGRFVDGGKLHGEWTDNNSGVKYNFNLEEKYPAGSYRFIMKNTSRLYGDRGKGRAYIEYIFPGFAGGTGTAMSKINNGIIQNMINRYDAGYRHKPLKNFEGEMTEFISRFRKFEKNPLFPSSYKPYWENSFYTSVIFNSDNIVVLENVDFRFEGGAHPNTYYTFYNYNVKTGDVITLKDIFKDGYKVPLDKIGERRFKEKYNIKQDENLEKAGYFLTDHKFHLNDNYAIFEKGLLFKFNPYEIAAYVFGAPEVFIPYSNLKDLLKEKSVLSAFIK